MEENILSAVLFQPNITIDMGGDLTLYEQRTYVTCLQKARKSLERDYDLKTIKVPLREFVDMLELSESQINNTVLKASLTKLVDTTVNYNITGQNKKIKGYGAFSLLSEFKVELFEKESMIEFALPPTIKNAITGQIKNKREEKLSEDEEKNADTYTARKMLDLMRVNSTSAIKLLGLVDKAKQSVFVPKLTVDKAKEILGVKGKYKGNWKKFEEFVLKPTVKEANDKGDKQIRYELERTGESAGRKNPKGRVKYIQFRFKMKPKNKIPYIGEVSNVYGLIELFPKHVQKYKTLPKILEGSIKKYGVGFTRKQCEYVVGHSKKAFINFLKTVITDENYKEYVETLPKIEDTTDNTTGDDKEKVIIIDETENKKIQDVMKKLFEELREKTGSPEMSDVMDKMNKLNALTIKKEISEEEKKYIDTVIIDYGNGSKVKICRNKESNREPKKDIKKEVETRNSQSHGVETNKIVNIDKLEKELGDKNLSDYSDNEIQAAIKKCVENEGSNEKLLLSQLEHSPRKLMESIKKYL